MRKNIGNVGKSYTNLVGIFYLVFVNQSMPISPYLFVKNDCVQFI